MRSKELQPQKAPRPNDSSYKLVQTKAGNVHTRAPSNPPLQTCMTATQGKEGHSFARYRLVKQAGG